MAVNYRTDTSQDQISAPEQELYNLIMAYRASIGLPAIPLSESLSITAARHALDSIENVGSYVGHAWSDAPYDGANSATYPNMWDAPERVGTPYTANGYEISTGYLGNAVHTNQMTPQMALQGWQNSAPHNAVITNTGTWANISWKAIGIGMYKGIAHVWFGEAVDPLGEPGGGSNTSTEGPDQLFGGAADNLLFGKGGNDTVFAGLGRDSVFAGDGDDVAYGGEGDDQVYGGLGNDTVGGGVGNDTIGGGVGDDLVFGGAGDDLAFGGAGNDNIVSRHGRDTIVAGEGADTINAGDADDVAYGAEGNDLLFGGAGADTLFGGAGADTLWGGAGDDHLWGGQGADPYAFAAGSGHDVVHGFNQAEGDRLDLQGQTFAQALNGSGHVVLTLSGGGVVTLEGVTSFSGDFIV